MHKPTTTLDTAWQEHKGCLRRLLASMTRDADTTEDLLQETYIRAGAAMPGYRGGDMRAWLYAIARSVFLTRLRRRWVRSEVPLDEDSPDTSSAVGASAHLDSIAVREAVDALSPVLKNALVMRHFGGLSYREIAERLGCPVGTAKRRVWAAMQRLKAVLAPVRGDLSMRCSEIRGTRLLDYVYGTLKGPEAEAVESHLEACKECSGTAAEIRRTMAALESFRDELVFFDVYELSPDGGALVHGSITLRNRSEEPAQTTEFSSMKYNLADLIFAQGEGLRFETSECEDDSSMNTYTIHLPRPLLPGESEVLWYVFHTQPGGPNAAEDLGGGRWRFVPDNSGSEDAFVRTLVVKLPPGARFDSSAPPPEETRGNGAVSLVWRWFVQARGAMFERPIIEYHLRGDCQQL